MVVKEEVPEKHILALNQLRETLQSILKPKHDDEYLLRFLTAREFNVEAATDMLRKHIELFQAFEYDELIETYEIPKKYNYYCATALGFDNEGSLVKLIGDSDYLGLVMSHTKQEAKLLSVIQMERDLCLQKKEGKGSKLTYIIDMKSITWRCLLSKQMARYSASLMKQFEANYPETLKRIYYINVSSAFEHVFNFMDKYLSKEILTKMTILHTDQVKPTLTSIMDPFILPAFLGGTKTDVDGNIYCYSLFRVKPGTPVPEEFYITTETQMLDKDPDAKKVVIKHKSQFVLTFIIDTPETTINWDFKTAAHDIGIGLNFKKLGRNKPTELIPIHRVDSHKFVESGKFECKERGTYELIFSNFYSVLTKKVLTYKTHITRPGDMKHKQLQEE